MVKSFGSETAQKEVLSRAEVCAMLGICVNTLKQLNIPRIYTGGRRVLFRRTAVLEWLAKNETVGGRGEGAAE